MSYRAPIALIVTLVIMPVFGNAGVTQDQEPTLAPERQPLAIPPGYRYDPQGRRDPFVNPVVPTADEMAVPDVRPPGLPGVLLNEAQLAGVVTSPESSMNVVLIRAPGDRSFIARAGDEMFDVVVKQILPNAVVFEVKPLEGEDRLAPREEVVRLLSQTEEND